MIIVGEGQGLEAVRLGYALAVTVGTWLPIVTLAVAAGGIVLARRRSTAIIGVGIGFALGAGSLAVSFLVGRAAVGIVAERLDLSPSALEVIYGRFVDAMTETAVVFTLIGVLLIVAGWLAGRSTSAVRVRGSIHGLDSAARRGLQERGLNTGGFGSWLAERRRLVRGIVAVLAVIWLFLIRPIGLGDVFLVVVTALVVAWILELLQRRPEEEPPADGDAPDSSLAGVADAPAASSSR
ncbi:hypothetical protein [Microbacterium invictum]|uniref:DUF2232 domain-containing protein n=1 Tax=Microbacterium invictum TaxID=515415 RepID=A0ABZ0VCG4_9MICO|nr:hypothetical protein [Microbacterium invictum]WQB71061.1 hypothetical protein T9R20_03610 [Microbacterium invictum]